MEAYFVEICLRANLFGTSCQGGSYLLIACLTMAVSLSHALGSIWFTAQPAVTVSPILCYMLWFLETILRPSVKRAVGKEVRIYFGKEGRRRADQVQTS